MHSLRYLVVLSALSIVSWSAQATPVRWVLNDIVFTGGDPFGTATGWFIYDSDTDRFYAASVTTTPGGLFPGSSYQTVFSGFTDPELAMGTFIRLTAPSTVSPSTMNNLQLTFEIGSLTNSGGIVPLAPFSNFEFTCTVDGCENILLWRRPSGFVSGAPLPFRDLGSISDISRDAIPDIAILSQDMADRPRVRYFSGANGQEIGAVQYLSEAWNGVAMATVADGNADGAAIDPAVAVLATRASDGRHAVHVRRSANGAHVNKIFFMGSNWTVIDLAVINDGNGDGVTGDTLIAVLGVNPSKPFDEQIRVQVRRLSDGALRANWFFLNGNWSPLALVAVSRLGASPLLAVLGNKSATGANVVQARRLTNGAVQRTTSFWDVTWRTRDLSLVNDADGDGSATDPAYIVLANHSLSGRNKVQLRRVSDGKKLKNIFMMGENWSAMRVAGGGDISGNLREEIGVLSMKMSDETIAIQLRDVADRTTTRTIFP